MTVAELVRLRRSCGLTQRAMATLMGLGARAYYDIEAQDDHETIHERHRKLAEWVSLDQAVDQENISIAPANVRRKALRLARLIEGS